MKSTLKRESKGLEVVKMETNSFSTGPRCESRSSAERYWRVARAPRVGGSVACSAVSTLLVLCAVTGQHECARTGKNLGVFKGRSAPVDWTPWAGYSLVH